MRALVVGMAAAMVLAGCSRQEAAGTNASAGTAATPVSPATPDARADRRAERRERRQGQGQSQGPAAGFSPRASISRAEWGGRMERRFRKLDGNQDDRLSGAELPSERGERMVRRLDTNGDKAISQDEWSRGMLARFDRRDTNKDGTLTPDERGKKGEGRRGGRRARGVDPEDTISDNGDAVDQDM